MSETYAASEKSRLGALDESFTLHPDVADTALAYFRERGIAWWGGSGPTARPISSQVACVNHLEPARLDCYLALAVVRRVVPEATGVVEIDDGFVAYEWIGERNYLGERGWSPKSRGRNVTSLDVVMVAVLPGRRRLLVAIEWKYTEAYDVSRSVAVSPKGTSRVEIYRPLLEEPGCPIIRDRLERLFYEPFYQLMRQTLLAWQMAANRERGVTDWRHIVVAPRGNVALRRTVTSPAPVGASDTAGTWPSVLKEPDRFAVLEPRDLAPGDVENERWPRWRAWLRSRYLT